LVDGDVVAVVSTYLAPFVPFLLRASQAAADEAARRFGTDAWARAKELWRRIGADDRDDPGGSWQQALGEAAADPGRARELLGLLPAGNVAYVQAGTVGNVVVGTQVNQGPRS
jgi:hypothetical protein